MNDSVFSALDKGDSIVITLPKSNLQMGLEYLGNRTITNPRVFFAAFADRILTFGEDESGDPAFVRLLEELVDELAILGKGIEVNDEWEEDLDLTGDW